MKLFKWFKPLLFARSLLWFAQEIIGSQPGHFGADKNLLPLPGIEP
jgi:hypothetical protein